MKRKRILSNLLCASLLFTFLIGTHEGRLSIWKDGDPTPAKVLPVPTALLPFARFLRYCAIGLLLGYFVLLPYLRKRRNRLYHRTPRDVQCSFRHIHLPYPNLFSYKGDL